jgi:two-component system OmpR family sensor kinase
VRRRLVITIVGAVVAALVLAGLGTLALAGIGARRYAEGELRSQVEAVTESLSTDAPLLGGGADRSRILATLRGALRLEGVGVLTFGADGGVTGQPPDGVTLSASDVAALRAGETISGRQGRLVYAGATIERGSSVTVIVLSDRTAIALGGTVLWFVLAATGVIALAVVAATRLARTLTEPLRRAGEVSGRIAEGDLSARVPEPPADASDELADVSRSINSMAAALERSRGLEQQFLLSVSHDLRTPLTSIQGYAEALADGTAADAPLAGSVILAESRRLDRLVRDLLGLASLDARRFSLEATAVDLHDLVEACVEGFGPEADAAAVTLEVHTEPAVVVADPDRLAQVVANLLDNALKFAERRVAVRVTVVGDRARVIVDDDGPGIDPADRPHVFERLYVARHRPVRRESGSGLGLAIVRELVVAMGGTVGVDASDSDGARLWFEIPSQDPNISLT